MKQPTTQAETDATDFFHRTQWAVAELAQLGPDLSTGTRELYLAHAGSDIQLTARATAELSAKLIQAFKLLEPFIAQLEGHAELKALAAGQKAANK